ncbi:MAG: RNA methyltransferase [Candidatus Gracilibacteria bacterium]|nr:RNA methyltransferase [Candidatus Gracilibacteria bacterium]
MITSLQNPILKNIIKLRKSAQERRKQNRMIIEGVREVSRALSCNWPINQIFFCEELMMNQSEFLDKIRGKSIELIQTSKKVIEKMSYRDSSQGILALASMPKKPLEDLKLPDNPLVLIAEGLEKPGNIGSLLRIADGAGVDALILCDSTGDVWNPNVVRASTGTLFSVPLAVASSEKTLSWLNTQKISKIITSPDSQTPYSNIDYRESCAIIIGSEQAGLTEKWMNTANEKVTIPMYGTADSLNAAISASIITYEALRQRS